MIAGASGSQIGGTNPVASRNIIVGNDASGIAIIADVNAPASNNIVRGNYIGYALGNGAAVPNQGSGILIQAANNTIGGIRTPSTICDGVCNVIAGNSINGITLGGNLATGNFVQGNYIGVGNDGTTALGNKTNGIQISNGASGNTIGGTGITPGTCNGVCNIIANSGNNTAQTSKAGIYVDGTGGVSNVIRGNSIFSNMGVGIDLGINPPVTNPPTSATGTTANDASDADTGANNLQNFPTLSTANTLGFIVGTLASTSNTNFALDFYRNNTNVSGDGRTYLGSKTITTDGSGNASFNFTTTVPLAIGQSVTATASSVSGSNSPFAPRAIGDTSEFSAQVQVTLAPPLAANANIGGLIKDANGNAIKGIIVTLLDGETGATIRATTNGKGFYVFRDMPVGRSYVVTPTSLRYNFGPNASLISHFDEQTDINFTAELKKKASKID